MKQKPKVTIVAFGDSITRARRQKPRDRWPDIVRRALQKQFSSCVIAMINAGAGGNTSREGLHRFEREVLSHAPQFVLVEFGNDATPEPNRHVSIEEFTRNLIRIKEGVRQTCSGTTILLTFPPIIDEWHAWRGHESYLRNGGVDRVQERYRRATRKLATARGSPLCDIDKALRKEMKAYGPERCILPDGVHLTAKGNQCVAEAVLKTLSPKIRKYLASMRGTGKLRRAKTRGV